MPGLNFILGNKPLVEQTIIDSTNDSLYFDGYSAKNLLSGPELEISFIEYDGYPCQVFENTDCLIVVEGAIYNRTNQEIEIHLKTISDNCSDKQDYKNNVIDFINQSDGEFVILMYQKDTGEALIFNDRWARMPAYYTILNNKFIFSREIKYILHWLPEIVFDQNWMAEFLIFEYTLGDKTIIKNIKWMKPAQLLHIYETNNNIKVEPEQLIPADFDGEDTSLSKIDCAERCAQLFKESLKNRVEKTKANRLNIIADLSGGHDSRAVFAGLMNLGVDFLACNDHLLEGAEAEIATKVAQLYNKSLVNFDTKYPEKTVDELSRLTYITDCQVNCALAFVGVYDELERKKSVKGRHTHFMGLGGEFFRHRYRPMKGYKQLVDMIDNELFTNQINTTDSCTILGLDRKSFFDNLRDEISDFPEKNIKGQVKHLNFERYNKFDNGGENRHRLFNWVVSPFWGKELFEFIVRIAPLKYLDYTFFIDFLGALDSKTLKVPVFAGIMGINPVRKLSLFNARVKLKRFLRVRPSLYKWSKSIISRHEDVTPDEKQKSITDQILKSCRLSNAAQKYFDYDKLSKFLVTPLSNMQLYQVLTLILYVIEIEKKFPDKIVNNQ